MWKFAAIGFVLLMIGVDVTTGALTGWKKAKSEELTREDVAASLAASAEKMNERKGERSGRGGQDRFVEAKVEGLTLVYEYELGWVPKGYNPVAMAHEAKNEVVPRVCGKHIALLKHGAAIKFSYSNMLNSAHLFDVVVRESDCAANA
jgi:hypothetical protein